MKIYVSGKKCVAYLGDYDNADRQENIIKLFQDREYKNFITFSNEKKAIEVLNQILVAMVHDEESCFIQV